MTPIMWASLNGHLEVVELLLKEHVDINAQKEDGWTALMLASEMVIPKLLNYYLKSIQTLIFREMMEQLP